MEIDKLIEGADIVSNNYGISKESTKQDQLGSCSTGNQWELDQLEEQDSDSKTMLWKIKNLKVKNWK
jgi:hypothetical protein